MCPVHEPLPGGDEDQWQCRRLSHAEIYRLRRQQPGVGSNEFGKRSLQASHAARHSIYFVARLEACNASSNTLDDAGDVNAEDGRRRMPRMRRLSLCIFRSSGLTALALIRTRTCPSVAVGRKTEPI
jgi:hypothetical protein